MAPDWVLWKDEPTTFVVGKRPVGGITAGRAITEVIWQLEESYFVVLFIGKVNGCLDNSFLLFVQNKSIEIHDPCLHFIRHFIFLLHSTLDFKGHFVLEWIDFFQFYQYSFSYIIQSQRLCTHNQSIRFKP